MGRTRETREDAGRRGEQRPARSPSCGLYSQEAGCTALVVALDSAAADSGKARPKHERAKDKARSARHERPRGMQKVPLDARDNDEEDPAETRERRHRRRRRRRAADCDDGDDDDDFTPTQEQRKMLLLAYKYAACLLYTSPSPRD